VALADATVAELLEQLAARTPAPGGGTGAALAGATAAALTEMSVAFALSRAAGDDEAIAVALRRAGALRARLLELADADITSYEPVLEALALEPGDSRRRSQVEDALSGAAEVPLEIAAACAEVTELAAASAGAAGNEHLLGDAGAAALIAEAATRAAVTLVEINLARSPGDPRLEQATALARRAWQQREIVIGRFGPGA
jgi:formiminotetrahydrofolate cyclodeaminase